ncbi:hypothetical protein ACR2XH_26435, partial [Klebsiella pneumoniae]
FSVLTAEDNFNNSQKNIISVLIASVCIKLSKFHPNYLDSKRRESGASLIFSKSQINRAQNTSGAV